MCPARRERADEQQRAGRQLAHAAGDAAPVAQHRRLEIDVVAAQIAATCRGRAARPRKSLTSVLSVVASVDSTAAARLTSAALAPLLSTAPFTRSMLWVMLAVPAETCSTLRAISWVAELCSTTAEAIVTAISLTWRTVPAMPWIASAAPMSPPGSRRSGAPISSVALAVCVASDLTSLATTAKPLPASPARAASIVAFKARRLVWPRCC